MTRTPTEANVHISFDAAGKFEILCSEFEAPLELGFTDDRVKCIDYEDLPVGCETEFVPGTPSVEIVVAPE